MAQEPLRECLCGEHVSGRGLTNHVRYRDDDVHGPRGTLPAGFDVDDRPIVGLIEVDMSTENRHPDHERWMCAECWDVFRGRRGLAMHLNGADPYHEPIDGDVDYRRHVMFPATDDRRILVPQSVYKHLIHLTEYEADDGWSVDIDDSVDAPGKISPDSIHPNAVETKTEIQMLDALREEFGRLIGHGKMDLDVVEAYEHARDAIIGQSSR